MEEYEDCNAKYTSYHYHVIDTNGFSVATQN